MHSPPSMSIDRPRVNFWGTAVLERAATKQMEEVNMAAFLGCYDHAARLVHPCALTALTAGLHGASYLPLEALKSLLSYHSVHQIHMGNMMSCVSSIHLSVRCSSYLTS